MDSCNKHHSNVNQPRQEESVDFDINLPYVRVFPRKTEASPIDADAYYTGPPLWSLDGVRKVLVSCTFSYDKTRAEFLADQWSKQGYDVQIGGPAYDDYGDTFTPGMFLKKGYVFTSRGCNNNCWFCTVPKREGKIRELHIKDGWRLLDSNLLQCSQRHIRNVFDMLRRQPLPCSFLGGLESRLIKDWHIDLLTTIKLSTAFFAYDEPRDYEPLRQAAVMLKEAGFYHSKIRCYCLIGYQNDTLDKAESRLRDIVGLDMLPMAMLYRDSGGKTDPEWERFSRIWTRPEIVGYRNKGEFGKDI